MKRGLFQRAREERLPQVAGSLTFTTVLSVVPLLAVSFALFTRVPAFRHTGEAIQQQLLEGLLPADLSRMVLKSLGRFAANAGGLTWVGSIFVLVSALALLMTVENALNRIWQAKKNRPVHQRLGIYVLMLALGPPALGASLWATSWLLDVPANALATLSPELALVLNLGPMLLATVCLACLFYYLPNTPVRRRDAVTGGLLAGIAFELGKRGFTLYLMNVPTYKTVYGGFAAVPAFLLWVYFSWLVTLAAALVAANLGAGAKQPGRRLSRA
jgi:membrane protein